MCKLYIKAVGNNRYAGGTCNWLLVRRIKENKDSYEISVKIKGEEKFTDISKNNPPANLIFKMGLWPKIRYANEREAIQWLSSNKN